MHYPIQELYSIQDTEDVLNRFGKKFLSIELSPGGFSYCVLDAEKYKYTLLESYSMEPVKDPGLMGSILEEFVKKKKILTSFYQRISIAYINPSMSLVPSDLFSYSEKKMFLDFSVYPDESCEVRVDKLNNLSAYLVYPLPIVLHKKINFLFPGCRIRHNATCLIENLHYLEKYGDYRFNLVLHIQKDHFEILTFREGNLQFFNSFTYQNADDLFYYLFFVLEQLGLDAEKLDTMIIGEVSIKSDIYKKLRLYVKSLSFGPRSDLYKFGEEFDEIPHHYFFNLLNINSCG